VDESAVVHNTREIGCHPGVVVLSTTEWIPPPAQAGQHRTNTYFHPEKMLPDDKDDSG
jgi:hypothetical protein